MPGPAESADLEPTLLLPIFTTSNLKMVLFAEGDGEGKLRMLKSRQNVGNSGSSYPGLCERKGIKAQERERGVPRTLLI